MRSSIPIETRFLSRPAGGHGDAQCIGTTAEGLGLKWHAAAASSAELEENWVGLYGTPSYDITIVRGSRSVVQDTDSQAPTSPA